MLMYKMRWMYCGTTLHEKMRGILWSLCSGSDIEKCDSSLSNVLTVRVRDHVTSHLIGHCQEVCGLKWSPSGHQLASGGNDNLLHIWDAAASASSAVHLHRLENHQAAVKALAWCPFQANLLASGGGTADRCIKFWNTQSGACINSIDTYSQVWRIKHYNLVGGLVDWKRFPVFFAPQIFSVAFNSLSLVCSFFISIFDCAW